ncbi:type II secretion system F family protein [Kitasatospora sp. RB6PN24]|uniref:type II secretion system F family protein n=1 Tax=Kitasatospora humi TaxID=2893891 RepID=UPI001E590D5F|nr:type II secretion system F family protein [Kitasatospora humi]MCC9309956.1 type II secretion system F family protein [Kitasatospora humi]
MILTLLTGSVCGLGLFLLVRTLMPARPGAAAQVARIDAMRTATGTASQATPSQQRGRSSALEERIGPKMAALYASQGWQLRAIRKDLAILDRSMESFLAQKVMFSAAGLLLGPAVAFLVYLAGLTTSAATPLWLTLIFIIACFFAPDQEVRTQARERRKEFQRALATYLTLVHLNLAGGAGLPEALKATSEVSDIWPMVRIRRALDEARLTGAHAWEAPGRLGEEIGVADLVDLTATLSLVAEDGARVRASLAARAETLRKRELADLEGAAAARSQSMLVAQLLLCFGFLIFLGYPALTRVMAL